MAHSLAMGLLNEVVQGVIWAEPMDALVTGMIDATPAHNDARIAPQVYGDAKAIPQRARFWAGSMECHMRLCIGKAFFMIEGDREMMLVE